GVMSELSSPGGNTCSSRCEKLEPRSKLSGAYRSTGMSSWTVRTEIPSKNTAPLCSTEPSSCEGFGYTPVWRRDVSCASSTNRSYISGYVCLPVVVESPQPPTPISLLSHSSSSSSSSSTSNEPVNPRPCPSSWSTTVTKSYCPEGGRPSRPKYHRSKSLLNVAK